MNFLQLIDSELKKRKGLSMEEKVRYIYLRSCQFFSYDLRYYYHYYFENGNQILASIVNKQIDLENIEDELVICKTHTPLIVAQLIRNILGLKVEIIGQEHNYILVYIENKVLKLDSCIFRI